MSRSVTRAGFVTKSGAVKVQVLLHPAEYAAIVRQTKRRSVSATIREIVAFHLAYPGGPIEWDGRSKYQRRGFAHE